jgi:predicted HD phosphohydrolase
MNLTPEQMLENYEKLVTVIRNSFKGERQEKLLKLYEDWGDRVCVAPASSKKQYHNGFRGGYVLHVLNVLEVAPQVASIWRLIAGELDFTQEELIFSALNHDLGKIGSEEHDYYVECKEDWMIRKGQVYVHNPELQYMKVTDRSIMVLANRGIPMTEKEYLAIKLHDGLYEESNKSYLISYNEDYELKTSLPHIIHQADVISAKCESILAKKKGSNGFVGKKEINQFYKPLSNTQSEKKGALGKFLSE